MMDRNALMAIDEKQLDEIRGLLAEGFADFVNVYLQEFEEKEREMLRLVENQQLEEVSKIAHTLRGSSLSVAATGLANVCIEIEQAGKQGNAEHALEECRRLHEIYPQFKAKYLQLTSS